MGRKRELMSRPADTADARLPPAARMPTDANWAAPANTRNDIAIAAAAPISGSASTPNDMPIARVGQHERQARLDAVATLSSVSSARLGL